MKKQKVIIIGAGIGGLTASIYLAQSGYDVVILEKNSYPGGRCASFEKDGHRFDLGATLLMMPEIYRRMYEDFGTSMEDELDLFRMDPVYSLRYANGKELLFTSDLAEMQSQLEKFEKGCYPGFLGYMKESYNSYLLSMKRIIDVNYYSIFDFVNIRNLIMLHKTKAFCNHYRRSVNYFKSEELRIAFTFQNIYVGQNPYHASAIFAMLPFLELTEGVWYPRGGMHAIVESLVSIAKSYGVEFSCKSEISSIEVTGNRVSGIRSQDGQVEEADLVVSNADLPYVYNELLPESRYVKKLNKLKYTCSALVFYWGMDRDFPGIKQHNVFVSKDYRKNIEGVFNGDEVRYEPSFYLHSPVKSDPTAAPDGQASVSIIIPLDYLRQGKEYDWDKIRDENRKAVFKRLEKEGIKDFEKHIKFESAYLPVTWKNVFNLSRGAVFGSLSHDLMQMGYFRPHNQHKKYKNLFFTGGSTHPGNGVPMAILSGKLTAEKVKKLYPL